MDDRIHVCYCVNRKVLSPLCVSVFSAAASVEGKNVTVWVFHEDFTAQDVQQVRSVLAPFDDVILNVRCIDLGVLSELHGLHGETIPLAKSLIPRLIKDRVGRIVYLDADTIVAGGLKDLYRHDLDGKVLGAVSYETLGDSYTRDFFRAKGLDLQEKAFNSGVLLVDVVAWNEKDLTSEVVDFLKSNSQKYDGADQVSLNVVFYKRFLPLRIRYNKRAGPDTRLEKKHTTDGILHFVGIPKPWDIGGRWLNKNFHLYERYRQRAGVPRRGPLDVVREKGWKRVAKGFWAGLHSVLR